MTTTNERTHWRVRARFWTMDVAFDLCGMWRGKMSAWSCVVRLALCCHVSAQFRTSEGLVVFTIVRRYLLNVTG